MNKSPSARLLVGLNAIVFLAAAHAAQAAIVMSGDPLPDTDASFVLR